MEPFSDDLAAQLTEILRHCVDDQGFALPAYAVAVGVNGSMQYFRCTQETDGWVVEKTAQLMELDGFQLPINVIVIDRTGERIARTVLDEEGAIELIYRN